MSLTLSISGVVPTSGQTPVEDVRPSLSDDEKEGIRADVQRIATKIGDKPSLRMIITPKRVIYREPEMATNTYADITTSRCSKARLLKQRIREEAARFNLEVNFHTDPRKVIIKGREEKVPVLVATFVQV